MNKQTLFHKFYTVVLLLALVLGGVGLPSGIAQAQLAANPPWQGGISDAWWQQAQETIRQGEYHLSWVDQPLIPGAPASFQAPNRAQDLRFYFQEGGVQAIRRTEEQPSWVWGVSLVGVGGGSQPATPQAAGLNVEANRITYLRGELEETYTNTEHGLVQSFKLASRPVEAGGGQLRLALRVSGDLALRRLADGGVEWQQDGLPILHYAPLSASDAQGNELAVQIAGVEAVISDTGEAAYDLQLVVEDRDAGYPVEIDLVITGVSPSNDWLDLGDQDYAHLGMSVATAGDVNGDGYSDVIIGAPDYDASSADSGMVFVYHGSANGLSYLINWNWPGGAGDRLGVAVATAGDVNGDGYSDMLVGAPDWESTGSLESEGIVYVFHGSTSGLSLVVNWQYRANQAHSGLGYAIGTAGDVDGDGYSDIIVGMSELADIEHTYGLFEIFYGSSTGLRMDGNDWDWGDQANCQLGFAVSTAGDVNGDGYSDVLASAPSYDSDGKTDNGRVYLYYGASSGLNTGSPTIVSHSESYGYYGLALSTAGDVNGDGYSDVIVGAPFRNGNGTLQGYTFVYHGSGSGLNTSIAWYVVGDENYGRIGNTVATAGDVNGDGYADVIIGQSLYNGAGSDQGRALLWLGSVGGLGPYGDTTASADWQVTSGYNDARFGYSVATAGDVNGDGYSDVIAGAPFYSGANAGEGLVYVFHGGPDNLSNAAGWSYTGDYANIDLGFSLASAGDINGDGYADVIVGAPYYDSSYVDEGAIFVWHGSLSGLNSVSDWWARSEQADARLGWSVDSAGDVNNDGYDDIIAGAPFFNNGSFDEGMAFVWLGSASGLGSAGSFANADWKAESNQANTALGYAVAGAGDLNGDGYADVAVGIPYYSWYNTNEGRVGVWYGSATGLGPDGSSSNMDWAYEPNWDNQYLGISLAGAGDVNRDGFSDLLTGGVNIAYAWEGARTGLSYAGPDWLKDDPGHPGSNFGASVNAAGDINGDGYSDVIVGAPLTNGQQGAAYAYCGSAGGTSYSACWSDVGGSATAQFGASVAGAGDVNGDGYADILVGAPKDTNTEIEKGSARLYYGAASGPLSGSGGDWQIMSSSTYARLGAAVAGAGDVNGDGFADVLIGAPGLNSNRGQVQLFYGNGGRGKPIKPRQLLPDYAPLAHLGMTPGKAFMAQVFMYNPGGRGDLKLEFEVKTLQTAFTGTGTYVAPGWFDSGLGGGALYFQENFLAFGKPYHWRIRFRYNAVNNPFNPPHSRWYHVPWNGWNEADLRAPYANIYLPLLRK